MRQLTATTGSTCHSPIISVKSIQSPTSVVVAHPVSHPFNKAPGTIISHCFVNLMSALEQCLSAKWFTRQLFCNVNEFSKSN